MKSRTFAPVGSLLAHAGQSMGMRVLLVLLGILMSSAGLRAQEAATGADPDKQTIQILLQRIERLEARVAQLEETRMAAAHTEMASAAAAPAAAAPPVAHPPAGPAAGPAAPPQTAAPVSEPEQETEHLEPERMDMSKTLLRMRGFGDITFRDSDRSGSNSSFSLGQLNLFVTSDISEKFKFLSEIVFESGPDNFYNVPGGRNNEFGVDVERYLVQYSYNDYFNLAIGRYHTAIGFYNTAYHHSTWFQTTTGRPLLFQFEDSGGILPIHNVGLSASGRIPSGTLGLHYVAEIGNGRASRTPLSEEPVQNEVDENSYKAFNLALFARPEAIHGLQVGFSGYHDKLMPLGLPRVDETILAAHAVYMVPKFEWLNEFVLVRHSPEGTSQVFNTPAFYTQIAKRFGSYQPYFRYQYINGSDREPIFPDVGRIEGPSLGVRYDASESVALKLQYDYNLERHQPGNNALSLQLGFTF
jgi:opacity protein-like surface antigen